MNWSTFYVYGWVAILAALGAWEGYALLHGHKGYDPPLTQLVTRYSPWWVTLPFIVWLFVHFAVRSSNAAYIAHLRGK